MKKWSPGAADAAWKIMICARDAARADDVIQSLTYIMTESGSDTEGGLKLIREMSGAQIVDALVRYQHNAHAAVQNGQKGQNNEG